MRHKKYISTTIHHLQHHLVDIKTFIRLFWCIRMYMGRYATAKAEKCLRDTKYCTHFL